MSNGLYLFFLKVNLSTFDQSFPLDLTADSNVDITKKLVFINSSFDWERMERCNLSGCMCDNFANDVFTSKSKVVAE